MLCLLKNGRVVVKENELRPTDILISNGKIAAMGENLSPSNAQVIDLKGKLISPGFIDVHVHLREPGGEHKETIATGTKAAARGGFTTICAMPNTKPVPDHGELLEDLQKRIRETAVVNVLPYGSISKAQKGAELADFESLQRAGAFAFSDDGFGTQSAGMMLEAMKRASALGVSIVGHCEDESLLYGGCVHEGEYAKRHGLPGISSVSESVHVARDILLAEASGCHFHACHLSTKESVRVMRDAKKAGIKVSAEVAPHHLLLCDIDIPDQNPNFKMNPPLRSPEDRQALIEGLLDGTIDMIATDHAPHTQEEKALGMLKAPCGVVGLESVFPLLYTHLVQKKILSLSKLLDLLTWQPARVFKMDRGVLKEGAAADITIIDLEQTSTVDPEQFLSKGKNTPFAGWKCQGWPVMTMVAGKIVYGSKV